MKKFVVLIFLAIVALLSACSPKAVTETATIAQAASAENLIPSVTATSKPTDIPPTQTATPTPEPTATPTPALKLVYGRYLDDINLYDLDTNETFPLVQNVEKIGQWSLSPDQKSLIYQLQISSDALPDALTYLLDLTTKQVRGPIPYPPGFVWHPSGKAILGFNLNTGQYDLYQLEDGIMVGQLPYGSFSPDGTQLAAFVGRKLQIYDIRLDADGQVARINGNYSEFKLKLGENIDPGTIIWSPAGDKLAFGASHLMDYPKSYFYMINPDGSGLVQLADSTTLEPGVLLNIYSYGVINFSWSPDGSQLAFIAHTFLPEEKYITNPQVYVVSTDGASIRKISEEDLFPVGSSPLWTPDGQLLLSIASSGDSFPVVKFNLENGERIVLSENFPSYHYLFFLNTEEESLAGILAEPFAFTCATGWTRLEIGNYAIVAPGSPNRVRTEPRKGDNLIVQIKAGTVVKVLDGPVCADGLVFWKVESESISGGPGWTAEGDGVEHWLVPYP